MNLGAHLWTILTSIVIFIMAFLIWFWGFWSLQDNLASDNLSDAVRTATYLSHDGSSRLERGSFIINTKQFKQELDRDHIKAFNGKQLKPGDYKVTYLADNAADRDANGNDHNMSHSDSSENKRTSTPIMTKHDDGTYKTIRGVRVSVKYPARSKLVREHHRYSGDRFTATEIIQTYGKNADHDTHNDLTR